MILYSEYLANKIEQIKKDLKINSEYPKIIRDKNGNIKMILIHNPKKLKAQINN